MGLRKRSRPLSKRKSEALVRYESRIDIAKRYRQHEALDGADGLWQRLIDLYRGKQFPKSMTDEDRISINLAFSTINVIAPSIAINYPRITISAQDNEAEDSAQIAELAINYGWKQWNVKPEFRRAVDDFLILGFGWCKTGYRFVEEDEERSDEEYAEEFVQKLDEYEKKASEDAQGAGSMPTDEEIAANISSTKSIVVEDRPFVERISPFDIFVDPEATSMQDLRWIAQRTVRPIAEVRADDNYKKTARENVKADTRLRDEMRPKNIDDGSDAVQRCTVWEFYDLVGGHLCVFGEGAEDFLVEPTEMPYAFGHPFVMLRNYEVPDQFYPMGELEALEPLQHELNLTRSALMNDRKRYRRKWLYRKQDFNNKGIAALESTEDNVLVPVEGNKPFEDVIVPMPVTPLPPEFYQQSEMIQTDINTISGINEYMRGALPEIRRTATEASIIQDAANARAADKLALVEEGISSIARNLVMLMQQYMTEDHVARMTAKNGNPIWVAYNKEEIQGEFDFEVAAGSTQPRNETARRQTAMQMLQALGPLADPTGQGGIINMHELIRFAIEDGFGIPNPQRFLNDDKAVTGGLGAPPPVEGQSAEQAMLAAGIPAPGADVAAQEPPAPEGTAFAPSPNGMDAELAGIPPHILAQLAGQMGLDAGVPA